LTVSSRLLAALYRTKHYLGGEDFRSVGYLRGSYRIATAPEPNSSRLTSLKSTGFDSPANNVGPWPASLACTTSGWLARCRRGATLRCCLWQADTPACCRRLLRAPAG
jgi:hypothetical protein